MNWHYFIAGGVWGLAMWICGIDINNWRYWAMMVVTAYVAVTFKYGGV